VRVTIVDVKKQYHIFWVCVCSLSLSSTQSACAVLYCQLWTVRNVQYFPTISHKDTTFEEEKTVIEHKKFDLVFSINFAW